MDEATPERWLPVPGYEGLYEVSDRGRVWSAPRATTRGGILKQSLSHGYLVVNLTKRGVQKVHQVHQLVATAFIGPRPEGMETRHLDGNPQNSRVTNLVYGTHSDNMRDALRHGTHPTASKTHCPQGHPYDEKNTIIRDGRRFCRECARANGRRQAARKRKNLIPLPQIVECPVCEGTFEKVFPTTRQKYCSSICKMRAQYVRRPAG